MKQLQPEQVIKKFHFTMNKGMSVFSMQRLLSNRYTLDFDVFLPAKGMNLQRPLCWSALQKEALILSMIKGIALPNITLIQHTEKDGSSYYQVIDGKQRITTILSYLKGEFPINVDGQEYYYENLHADLQFEISGYYPKIDIGYSYWDAPISDDDKIAWFEQINFLGTPQDAEHLKALKSQPAKLSSLLGQWPGDENDKEFQEILND